MVVLAALLSVFIVAWGLLAIALQLVSSLVHIVVAKAAGCPNVSKREVGVAD